jgi:hypothetical protein
LINILRELSAELKVSTLGAVNLSLFNALSTPLHEVSFIVKKNVAFTSSDTWLYTRDFHANVELRIHCEHGYLFSASINIRASHI